MYTWPCLDARSRVGRQDRAPGIAAAVSSRLTNVLVTNVVPFGNQTWHLEILVLTGYLWENPSFMGFLTKFAATLMLLRAGIVEGLRIFEIPCRWIFDM